MALQSRTKLSVASSADLVRAAATGTEGKERAVEIDYPRSYWRMGGNPLAGRNRTYGVGGHRSPALGTLGTRSPPLDSRCLAFCRRSEWPPESELTQLRDALPLGVVRFVARAVAPHGVQNACQLAGDGDRSNELAASLLDLRCPLADGIERAAAT